MSKTSAAADESDPVKVLLIEDVRDIVAEWQAGLRDHGFNLVAATTIAEAETHARDAACILLDFRLQVRVLSGDNASMWKDIKHYPTGDLVYEHLERVIHDLPPVVLFTNYYNTEEVRQFFASKGYGALFYINKDDSDVDFGQAARRLSEIIQNSDGGLIPKSIRESLMSFLRPLAQSIQAGSDRAGRGSLLLLTGPKGAGKSDTVKRTIIPVLTRMCPGIEFRSRDLLHGDDGPGLSEFMGRTERDIDSCIKESHRLFQTKAPTVIVWCANEIERYFPARDGGADSDLRKHFTRYFLDALDSLGRVGPGFFPFIVVGSTNDEQQIDSALEDRAHCIRMPLPSKEEVRRDLARYLTNKSFYETQIAISDAHVRLAEIIDELAGIAFDLQCGWRQIDHLKSFIAQVSQIGMPPSSKHCISELRSRAENRILRGGSQSPHHENLAGTDDAVLPTKSAESQSGSPATEEVSLDSMSEQDQVRAMAEDLLAEPFETVTDAMRALGEGTDRLNYWGKRFQDDPIVKTTNFVKYDGYDNGRMTHLLINEMICLRNAVRRKKTGGQMRSWIKFARTLVKVQISHEQEKRISERVRLLSGAKSG